MHVKDIMTQPVTIDKSERLGHALDLMEKNDLRRLLVTNKDKMGGIITTRQIARVLGTRNPGNARLLSACGVCHHGLSD